MKSCLVLEAGLTDYREALRWQERLSEARRAGLIGDTLLLLEHPPIFTFGRQGGRENLLLPEPELKTRGIDMADVNRGGNVTFHGPGQLVGYPVLDLGDHVPDVHWYLGMLEEVLIRAAGEYGVAAVRRPGLTGVWVGGDKLASIGVALRGWVTTHGFAINVANDLRCFEMINPCGLKNTAMTSLSLLLGRPVEVAGVADKVKSHFAVVFGVKLLDLQPGDALVREMLNGRGIKPPGKDGAAGI